MNTTTPSAADLYSDPFPGRKGAERITVDCGKCSGTGVYSGPSGVTFYTKAVDAVAPGCFDCFGAGTRSFLVSSARATARAQAKRQAASLAQAAIATAAREAFLAAHGDLVEELGAVVVATKDRFLSDLLDAYLETGKLTAAQVADVQAGLLAVAARLAAKVPVVEGRYEIVGKVLSQKAVESAYGYTLKMLVAVDGGYKVWGSVPSSLDVETGARIAFTATVERSAQDVDFGFFKRPAKARVL